MTILLLLFVLFLLIGGFYWVLMSSYSQFFGSYPYKVSTNKKVVALTFDDGPNEPYTSQILEYLREQNIKATFFLVGKCVERYPETVKLMLAEGHVIGNHSLSHEFHKYFLSPSFSREILENQAVLQRLIGKLPALYRSPWLWRQPLLLKAVRRNGLQPVSGKFCHDFEVLRPRGSRIAARAIKRATPGSILIFHDGIEGRGGNRQQTVDAVKLTVEELIKRNYRFVTVDRLLGVPAYQ